MTVLAFLQNTWVRDPVRAAAALERMGTPERRRALHTAWLFAGCLTGQRIQRAFGPEAADCILWDNASPRLGSVSSSSFPADPEHIGRVLEEVRPDVVLAFGRVAEGGVRALWSGPLVVGPHPAARGPRILGELDRMAQELAALLEGARLRERAGALLQRVEDVLDTAEVL